MYHLVFGAGPALTSVSRRDLLLGSGAVLALSANPAWAADFAPGPRPALYKRALGALHQHRKQIRSRDVIGVVDFAAPSRLPRFHIVDVATGRSEALLVAHGRGSDPDHSGWLERFSNLPGSAASSSGAYLTGDSYWGTHGASRRLVGLDPENCNAEARAIVIHGAWYVSPEMIRERGKIGRSEGCFAFAQYDLDRVLRRLGPGRMIYADKV